MKKMILVLGMSLLAVSAQAGRVEKSLQKFDGNYTTESNSEEGCSSPIRIESSGRNLSVYLESGAVLFSIEYVGQSPRKKTDSNGFFSYSYHEFGTLSLSGRRVADYTYGSPLLVGNGAENVVRLTKDGVVIPASGIDEANCFYKKVN